MNSAEHFDQTYHTHRDMLVSVAVRNFRVPPSEAEALAHDVFVSLLDGREVRDVRSYLLGGICTASRYFWRCQRRRAEVPVEVLLNHEDPRSCGARDRIADVLTARALLDLLPPQQGRALRLYFWGGCTAEEISTTLELSHGYAQNLMRRAQAKARVVYMSLDRSAALNRLTRSVAVETP